VSRSPDDGLDPGVELVDLEELEVEAATHQVTVHAPAQRAHVVQDARTVVVSEARRPEPGRNDPTLVLRAVREPPPGWVPRKPAPRTRWWPWVLLVVAALVAFGGGGVLALYLAHRSRPPETPATP
jgi:hypothetical protein